MSPLQTSGRRCSSFIYLWERRSTGSIFSGISLRAFSVFLLTAACFMMLTEVKAQTCCSGGVPLTNNVGGLPVGEVGDWQLSLNLDINILRTLKSGSTLLDDDSRERITYSAILATAYTFNPKLSAEGLFSWIRQERTIRQRGGFEDFTSTSGIGDAILLLNYTYLSTDHWSMIASLGPKIPLGSSDLASASGITLNADMQPGSGAWDGILNHRILYAGLGRPSMVVSNNLIFRLTGTNHDYLGSQSYQFGNELHLITGVADQMLIANQLSRSFPGKSGNFHKQDA